MRYQLLGKSGLRVSELCLGTMTFGDTWGWGASKEVSRQMFDLFAEAGGNYIDSSVNYTDGTAETLLGEFLQGRRDQFVVTTKYTLTKPDSTDPNSGGNSRKNMMKSVERSLKHLQTESIDVYYLHMWDYMTPVEEVMRGLDDLVRMGKVNYVAISDTPAWIVSKGQTMAELMGWSKLVALQVEYSLLQRTPERELIPMAKHYGMTVTPWAPLAGGALTGKYLQGDKGRLPDSSKRLNDNSTRIAKEVVTVAQEIGCNASHVALKWTMQQGFSSIPIVGATKPEQILDNLKCVDVTLSPAHISRLNSASAIEMGFPHDFFKEDGVKLVTYGGFYDRIEHSSL